MSAPTVTPAARRLAKAAGVRPVAAQRVLDGLEVWPGTYEAVSAVALACGVVDLPPPAPRASRRAPCPACAAKDAELAAIRARVAELEARPVGGSSVGRSLAVVPIGPEAPTPAADPPTAEAPTPPRPAPQPDATTRALERAVGRPCTVRVDMGDGVLVRAAEVAG